MSVAHDQNKETPGEGKMKFKFQSSKWKSDRAKFTGPNSGPKKTSVPLTTQASKTIGPQNTNKSRNVTHQARSSTHPISCQTYTVQFTKKCFALPQLDFNTFVDATLRNVGERFGSQISLKSFSRANLPNNSNSLVIEVKAAHHVHSQILKMLEVQFNSAPYKESIQVASIYARVIFGPSNEFTKHISDFNNLVVHVEHSNDQISDLNSLHLPFQTKPSDLTKATVTLFGIKNTVSKAMDLIENMLEDLVSKINQFKFTIPSSKIQLFNQFQLVKIINKTKCLVSISDAKNSASNDKNASITGCVDNIPRALAYILGMAQCLETRVFKFEHWALEFVKTFVSDKLTSKALYDEIEIYIDDQQFSIKVTGTKIDLDSICDQIQKGLNEIRATVFFRYLEGSDSAIQELKTLVASNGLSNGKIPECSFVFNENRIYIASESESEVISMLKMVKDIVQTYASVGSVSIIIDEDLNWKCKREKEMLVIPYLLKDSVLKSERVPLEDEKAKFNEKKFKISGPIDLLNEMCSKFDSLVSELNEAYSVSRLYYGGENKEIVHLEGMVYHVQHCIKSMKVDFYDDTEFECLTIKGKAKNVEFAVNEIFNYFDKIQSFKNKTLVVNANRKMQLQSKVSPKDFFYSISKHADDQSKLLLTLYAETNFKAKLPQLEKIVDTLTAESTAKFSINKQMWNFLTMRPKLLPALHTLPSIFSIHKILPGEGEEAVDANNANQSAQLVLLGMKGKQFEESTSKIYNMVSNMSQKTVSCSELARKHLLHLCSKNGHDLNLAALDKEVAKSEGLVFYHFVSPNLVIKGEKNAVEKLQELAEDYLGRVTHVIRAYPTNVCAAVIGKNASKKIELQAKFNVTIIVPNLASNMVGEHASIETIGLVEDCERFHNHIGDNFKEHVLKVSNSLIGAICGRENRNIKELNQKFNVNIRIVNSKDESEDLTISVLGLDPTSGEKCLAEIKRIIDNNARHVLEIPDEAAKYITRKSHNIFSIKNAIQPANLYMNKNQVTMVGKADKVKIGEKMITNLIDLIMDGNKMSTIVPKEVCGRLFGRLMKNLKKLEADNKVQIYTSDISEHETLLEVFGQNEEMVKHVIDTLNERINKMLHGGNEMEEENVY